MTGNKGLRGLIVLMFIAALACPMLGQSAGGKIKVIVENASLRVKPSMDAEILEDNIPVATVFNVERKIGEWYEVKYQSKLGVMITGYIHEMFVEALPSETGVKPAEPPKKEGPKPAPTTPRPYAPGTSVGPKLEVGLAYGLGLGSPASETSTYSRSVPPAYVLRRETGNGTMTHKLKGFQSVGFSLSYYFSGGFGIQLRVDFNFKQDISEGSSDFASNWTWTDDTTGSRNATYALSGEMSLMPISLNLIYKIPASAMFQPYLSAGLSYLTGSFKADSTAGYPFWYLTPGFQNIDYLAVPIAIDESLSGLGGNIGGGVDVYFSPTVAFNIGAIYFLGKEFSFNWSPAPGTYRGELHTGNSWLFPQALATDFQAVFTPVTIKTSFFKLLAGFKIGF